MKKWPRSTLPSGMLLKMSGRAFSGQLSHLMHSGSASCVITFPYLQGKTFSPAGQDFVSFGKQQEKKRKIEDGQLEEV